MYRIIGKVATTHGVRGAIKVFPLTDDKKRFDYLDTVFIEDVQGKLEKYQINKVKYVNKFVVLELKEMTTMDEALSLKQGMVKIHKEEEVALCRNEYYIDDLEGIDVEDITGKHLGKLKEVLLTGANDVYIIELKNGKELLLPAIKECILNVDIKKQVMQVHVLEGLMP